MDVIVGRIPPMGKTQDSRTEAVAPIEAKVLHVRQPRRSRDPGRAKDGNARHGKTPQIDPPGARVLVLLVPDAYRLPDNLNEADYRIFLRIVRR